MFNVNKIKSNISSNKSIALLILSFYFNSYHLEASIKDYYKNIVTKGQDFFTRNKTEVFNKEYNINKTNPIDTVNIANINGNINIKSWKQNKIEIKAVKKAIPKHIDKTNVSTNIKNKKLNIETITKEISADINYNLILPENTNLFISTNKGNIKVKNISGSIQAIIENSGNISISNSEKTVIAKTQKGTINIKPKQIQKPDTIFLDSSNGSITLSLPKESSIDLQLSTQKGQITSKQEIILSPRKVILNKQYWNQVKKEVNGKVKHGGSLVIVEVKTGNIKLEEH